MNTTIQGGNIPLIYHAPNIERETINSWRKRRYMFKGQLVSVNGCFLETWDAPNQKLTTRFKTRQPKWHKKLEEHLIVSDNNRKLLTPLSSPPTTTISYRSPKIRNTLYFRPKNEWTMTWVPHSQDIIYGKTIEQVNELGAISITY